ncbi:MAG: amino acid ABC transporter substrate-binding protein, partial [Chloroflexi bacterium]
MMKRLTLIAALVLVLLALGLATASAQDAPVLNAIVERGSLNCGVNNTLPGFGFPNDAGEFEGFDVDFCRAVAAAVLGDANAVNFRPLTAAERPTALGAGEIDLLSRNTTWTLSRDTTWGATFAPTTFYDGQGVMVRVADGISTLEDLEGGTICTNAGTTTELNISDAMGSRGLDFDLQTFQDFDAVMDAFNEGRCDAVTSDKSGLLARKATHADPGS